jgi:hypothetical protein
MKTLIAVALSIILFSGYAAAGQPHKGRIGDRQWRQQERIKRGILTGQLTRREAGRLIREQHRIQHMRKEAWRDHRLSPRERRRIKKRLDKADRHIVMLKSNRYYRPRWNHDAQYHKIRLSNPGWHFRRHWH